MFFIEIESAGDKSRSDEIEELRMATTSLSDNILMQLSCDWDESTPNRARIQDITLRDVDLPQSTSLRKQVIHFLLLY